MKLYVFLFVALLVLVQAYLSYAELSESSSENENLNSAFNKRLSTQWGKRLQKVWGKRSDNDKSELYQHLLRGLYHNARLNRPQYAADDEHSESLYS